VPPDQLEAVAASPARLRDLVATCLDRATTFVASPAAPWVVGAIAVVLRIARYAADRALWLDEAALALNITTRSYSHLFGHLDFDQGAPVGFLALEKFSFRLFGDAVWAARLPSFLAGLLVIPLFWRLASRFLDRTTALFAFALFAVLEPFVYYSSELKQYGFDVLVAVALALLFDRAFERPTVRRVAELSALAVVGVWFSHPAVFVLAGGGGVLAVVLVRRREPAPLVVATLGGAAAVVSFAVEYFKSIRHLHHLEAGALAAASTHSATILKNVYMIFADPGAMPPTLVGLIAFLVAVGAVVLGKRSSARVGFVALTVVVAIAVAEKHKYPLAKRWELFLLPFAVILLAEGAVAFCRATRLPVRLAAVAMATVVLVAPAATAAKHLHAPPLSEPVDTLLADISRQWHAGDTLYVSVYSQYPFRYYLRCRDCNPLGGHERALWPFRDTLGPTLGSAAIVPLRRSLVVGSPRIDLGSYIADFRRLKRRRRVWLLFTHTWPVDFPSLEFQLDLLGRRLETIQKDDSLVLLYDFTKPGAVPRRHA
jgi:4-amino-4-deoxy-L-arabinose transferase-like glycosyltransferase